MRGQQTATGHGVLPDGVDPNPRTVFYQSVRVDGPATQRQRAGRAARSVALGSSPNSAS